jgi:hypothetical protein
MPENYRSGERRMSAPNLCTPRPNICLPPCFRASPRRADQSSHPDIEIPANPMKTITENFLNRHTFELSPIDAAHPARRDQAFGCLGPRINPSRRGEQKSNFEEKALTAVALAEEANRYTWKLENR